jgi:hypothetical protein
MDLRRAARQDARPTAPDCSPSLAEAVQGRYLIDPSTMIIIIMRIQ